jgi:hypothetical protein
MQTSNGGVSAASSCMSAVPAAVPVPACATVPVPAAASFRFVAVPSSLPPSRALRWLREADPRRRKTAGACGTNPCRLTSAAASWCCPGCSA